MHVAGVHINNVNRAYVVKNPSSCSDAGNDIPDGSVMICELSRVWSPRHKV